MALSKGLQRNRKKIRKEDVVRNELLIKDIAQQEQWRDVTELPLDFSKAAWKRKNAEMG